MISAPFARTLVPLSQAWCGLAVRKAGNTTLFHVASPTTASTDIAAVRAQIADWHLYFLAEPATEGDVETVLNDVFMPLEEESDARTAWIGTCSYFVRHPLFVFY